MEHLEKLLDQVGGDKKKAADMIGVSQRTIYNWLDGTTQISSAYAFLIKALVEEVEK